MKKGKRGKKKRGWEEKSLRENVRNSENDKGTLVCREKMGSRQKAERSSRK